METLTDQHVHSGFAHAEAAQRQPQHGASHMELRIQQTSAYRLSSWLASRLTIGEKLPYRF